MTLTPEAWPYAGIPAPGQARGPGRHAQAPGRGAGPEAGERRRDTALSHLPRAGSRPVQCPLRTLKA